MLMLADTDDFRLLNEFQRNFPLVSRPYALLGEILGLPEGIIIEHLGRLKEAGRISRIGPVFAPNRIGVSTLAALAVPEYRLGEVAALVSSRAEINHNYRREHAWNLWFVAAAPDRESLDATLADIERETELPVLALPLEREYHIDLGFDLKRERQSRSSPARSATTPLSSQVLSGLIRDALPEQPDPQRVSDLERQIVAVLQEGLPLVADPYGELARRAGISESLLIFAIQSMLDSGLIKRFGVVVRHHELGWQANAMCVWDVPDEEVDALGARLAGEDAVTLCYRRRRGETERQAGWHYNLFCMIHGQARETVLEQHADLCKRQDLDRYPSAVLFSTRRYKQCGARYARENANG